MIPIIVALEECCILLRWLKEEIGMNSARSVLCASLISISTVSTALGEGQVAGADAAIGENLAREICARCHNVEAGGPFKQHPPSFAAIAVYRSKEEILGRILYPPLHTGMPTLGYRLDPDNVRHLVAYIASLEAR